MEHVKLGWTSPSSKSQTLRESEVVIDNWNTNAHQLFDNLF